LLNISGFLKSNETLFNKRVAFLLKFFP
jgi:hypothetical protein